MLADGVRSATVVWLFHISEIFLEILWGFWLELNSLVDSRWTDTESAGWTLDLECSLFLTGGFCRFKLQQQLFGPESICFISELVGSFVLAKHFKQPLVTLCEICDGHYVWYSAYSTDSLMGRIQLTALFAQRQHVSAGRGTGMKTLQF